MDAIEHEHKTLADVDDWQYGGFRWEHWVVCDATDCVDATILDISNFESAREALSECSSKDYGIFGRYIAAKPGTEAHRVIAEINCALSGYPVVCESDYSDRVTEYQNSQILQYCEESQLDKVRQYFHDTDGFEDITRESVREALGK